MASLGRLYFSNSESNSHLFSQCAFAIMLWNVVSVHTNLPALCATLNKFSTIFLSLLVTYISQLSSTQMAFLLCFLFLLLSSATACHRCVQHSNAAYFSKASALSCKPPTGACGYGSLALGPSGGHLAAGVSSLNEDGAGCGACFQIRWKNSTLSELLWPRNLKLGIVDVEYIRIPCEYKHQNLAVELKNQAKRWSDRNISHGCSSDIIFFFQVGSSNWNLISRNNGAVWDTSRVPNGALQFRFVFTSGFDGNWIWTKSVLPADWKTGVIYDAGVRIADIAKEGCSPCDDGH
ncbi:hypothetical protein DITRI_Ditri01bG0028900 [Diplodiscus trichospermus]